MATPYQPITKEHAAEILSVSKRTINYWIADGTLPAPTAIGRRVYWHPDTFYTWLDQRLGFNPPTIAEAEPEPAKRPGRPRAVFEMH